MDPSPFLRIRVGNLALKLPSPQPPSSSSSYHCKIRLCNFPLQIATVSLAPPGSTSGPSAACFSLPQSDLDAVIATAKKNKMNKPAGLSLSIDVYRKGGSGFGSEKSIARFSLALDMPALMHNGWVRGKKNGSELFVSVRSDPDPRFVFEFDGEPECSPLVLQVQGSIKQPVFTCKFGFRSSGDRNLRSEPSTSASCWGITTTNRRSHNPERKGWTVAIHDLSGSPVALASMATPFVPSPGSDRVSRSNPGAWLILRPTDGTWKPWGRLESWCDRSSTVSHRFEIITGAPGGVTLATGGKFSIDTTAGFYSSPMSSPNGSFDLGSWSGSGSTFGSGSSMSEWMYKGFVMASTVGGEKTRVEVGAQHVNCTEDAAVFVALAAAADLSVDACRPFSRKLRKELRQPSEEVVV